MMAESKFHVFRFCCEFASNHIFTKQSCPGPGGLSPNPKIQKAEPAAPLATLLLKLPALFLIVVLKFVKKKFKIVLFFK